MRATAFVSGARARRTAAGAAALPKSKLERFVKFKPQTPPREIIRLRAE
jgi:hypothetical protein